ncbi:MAG: hypothetical protein AAFR54_12435 [Planctomycetota bacterium]
MTSTGAHDEGPADAPADTRARPTRAELFLLLLGSALVVAHAWHLDDAFVYFRYVDNWVLWGHGPVHNPGEWVEGYSSPAWLLVLAALRGAGLEYWDITRSVGVLAWGTAWWLLVRARRAASPVDDAPGAAPPNLALALLAGHYAVASYFTSGTESPLVLVVACAFVLLVHERGSRAAQVLAGLAPLVRPELLLPLALFVALDWRRSGRWLVVPITFALVTNLAWLVFRVWAYADVVPNTFHLKDRAHLDWGLAYLHDALLPYGGYVAVGAAVALAALGPRGLRAPRWTLLALAGIVTVYVVRIGGDGRHFRYLLFPYALVAGATLGAAPAWLRGGARSGLATIALGLLVALSWPRQLDRHPLLDGVEETRVGVIRDAWFHRAQPELRAVGPHPAPDALEGAVGVTGWCHEAWASPHAVWIHKDGLTEPILAHSDAVPFRPAHFDTTLPAAEEIARVRATYGQRGAFRRAVEAGDAAPWVEANLEALDAIEARAFNGHRFGENLGLALSRVPTVRLGR